jgi:hemin uptake protein HemP
MMSKPGWSKLASRVGQLCLPIALLLVFSLHAPADGSSVNIVLDVGKAGPRAVEDATRNRITADYRFAWTGIAQALEGNTTGPLQGAIISNAKMWLSETITRQRQSGLSTLYSDQNHRVDVAFYAPEGDVIELHDTAEYRMQVLDQGKPIHDERVVQRYIVLMTPAADRWVIRELQAVSRF